MAGAAGSARRTRISGRSSAPVPTEIAAQAPSVPVHSVVFWIVVAINGPASDSATKAASRQTTVTANLPPLKGRIAISRCQTLGVSPHRGALIVSIASDQVGRSTSIARPQSAQHQREAVGEDTVEPRRGDE